MYRVSDQILIGQAFVIIFTTAFFLLSIPYYYFSSNVLLPLGIMATSILFNWMASRKHFIYIKEGNIYIESLYAKQKVLKGDLFSRIEMVSGSTYYLYLTNGKRYSFSRSGNLILFLKSGEEAVIKKITDNIKQVLNKSIE